jgi:hypothetical protein
LIKLEIIYELSFSNISLFVSTQVIAHCGPLLCNTDRAKHHLFSVLGNSQLTGTTVTSPDTGYIAYAVGHGGEVTRFTRLRE